MAMNPVLALINCDSEDKFVRDVVEAYFQNPIHVRDLLTEDCIEACLDDYMRNQDVIADVRDLSCDNEVKLSRKSRRAVRIERNKRKKGSDRAHGKRRKDSAKNLRRWENDEAQMERAQVMWHLNNKGDYIPRPLDRKYHEKRYLRTMDASRIPVYYVDTTNHLDMEYKVRKRTIEKGCVVYDYVPAIVTPEAVQGEPV